MRVLGETSYAKPKTKELISELTKAIVSHDPGSFGLYFIIQAKEKRDLKWAICNFIEKQPDDEMKNILEALGKLLLTMKVWQSW